MDHPDRGGCLDVVPYILVIFAIVTLMFYLFAPSETSTAASSGGATAPSISDLVCEVSLVIVAFVVVVVMASNDNGPQQ